MGAITYGQVLAGGLGDCRLVGIEWTAGGEDLRLIFEDPERSILCLKAVWATEVRLDLDFGKCFGKPLVFRASVEEIQGEHGMLLRVDFGGAPDGFLSLRCNDLVVDQGLLL